MYLRINKLPVSSLLQVVIEVPPVVSVVGRSEHAAFDALRKDGLIEAPAPKEVKEIRIEDVRLNLGVVLFVAPDLRLLRKTWVTASYSHSLDCEL